MGGGGGDGAAADAPVATVRLRLNADGDVVEASAAARPRALPGGGAAGTPWRATMGDYGPVAGADGDPPLRLPRCGEAAWLLPDGPFVYWRGVVTAYRVLRGAGGWVGGLTDPVAGHPH